ncbi:MAG: LacI family DNA-binding transcriptional regulator [Phycisphaerae bacterium]|nr:LacI family DNA-binding transcriptional regulator [Phycisphaerae bacterium]
MAPVSKGVTQKTIADKLNLHPTTVSMALRGVKLIAPETRRRVVQMARALNYQPNVFARNLRTQTSNMIGIIAPSLTWPDITQARIAATARLAHREGFNLMMYYRWPEEDSFEGAVQSLRGSQVAALIVSDMSEYVLPRALKDWADEDRPILFMAYFGENSFNTIDTDRMEGFRMAAEYLLQLGHRRLAIVLPEISTKGIASSWGNQIRLEGFRKGLAEAGLPCGPEQVYIYERQKEDGIPRAMKRLADASPRPTGLLAFSDETASICMRELMRLGLSVPKDISIVGLDDSRLAKNNVIPITTIRQPSEELADRTVRKLVDMVRGDAPRRFETILYPPELILRETTAPPTKGGS